jgi:hypothetical protein
MRRTPHALPAAAVLSLAVLTAGCGSTPSDADGTRTDTLAAAAGSEDSPAAGAGSPALDPLAPTTYRPVVRDGKQARPNVVARGGRFSADAPVIYPDGIVVRVDRVSRSVEQGEGVGVFPGRPLTAFHVTFENGSAGAVDLSQTVVTTTYGVRPRVASPVYTHPEAQDFSGTVAPGATAQATYVFAVPPGQARTVRTMVDFDAAHAAATLTGLDEG